MLPTLFDKVINVLTPDLGTTMARSSIKMFLNKENITAEKLDYKDLLNLANRLKPGLTVFVGSTRASLLANKIVDLKEEGSK